MRKVPTLLLSAWIALSASINKLNAQVWSDAADALSSHDIAMNHINVDDSKTKILWENEWVFNFVESDSDHRIISEFGYLEPRDYALLEKYGHELLDTLSSKIKVLNSKKWVTWFTIWDTEVKFLINKEWHTKIWDNVYELRTYKDDNIIDGKIQDLDKIRRWIKIRKFEFLKDKNKLKINIDIDNRFKDKKPELEIEQIWQVFIQAFHWEKIIKIPIGIFDKQEYTYFVQIDESTSEKDQ